MSRVDRSPASSTPNLRALKAEVRRQRAARQRLRPPQVATCRVSCPDCHVLHDIPTTTVGMSNWNLCPACSRRDEAETRAVLAARGITLPYVKEPS